MNDKFSDAFKSIVPEPPSTDGFVPGARRKRRNRQLIAGGGVAALALAVAIPMAINLSGQETMVASPVPSPTATSAPSTPTEPTETPSETPTQTPSTTADPGAVVVDLEPARDGMPGAWACYQEDGKTPLDAANTGPDLPTGLARVFLCGDAPDGYMTVGPLDPLVVDPDRVVELFQAQPDYVKPEEKEDPEANCGYESSSFYRLILEYKDGDKRVITYQHESCQPVTDGTTQKAGEGFQEKIAELWADQRATATTTSDPLVGALCPALEFSVLPVTLDDTVAGIACSAQDGIQTSRTTFDGDLAARIAAAAKAEGVAGNPDGLSEDWIVLTDTWGDQFPMRRADDGAYFFRGDTEMMLWTPAPELAAEIDQAIG